MHPLLLATLALAACALLFAGCFALARRMDNYGIVDVLWSYAFGPVAILYAALADGWAPRRFIVALFASLWAFRLGTHLYRRVMSHHPEEDGRYQEMRTRWAPDFTREMFKFYLLQAVSVVILATPFLLATGRDTPRFTPIDFAGYFLFLFSLGGEFFADHQLAAFKKNPDNRGKVCDAGLWGWSRHPNYFFVWLTWVAFALFALPAAWGWLGLIAPASILYLLLFVTGIPMTEEQSIRSRGDAYRDYQKRVSVFVPLPPKKTRTT